METQLPVIIAVIAVAGVAAQWVAWRTKLPAIVLLALSGLLLGPISGFLQPALQFGDLLRPFIGVCVSVILFEGGLNLQFHEISHNGRAVRRLATVGVVLNWGLTSAAAYYIGGLSLPVALVFGAILVVTGPTVIMPLLRQAGLAPRVSSILKWESIVNDPIGALLAVLIFQYFLYTGDAAMQTAFDMAKGIGVGVGLGGGIGYLAGVMFRRGAVPEFLKQPVMLSAVVGVYTLSNLLQHEAGLLAVTVMGVVVGNMGIPSIDELRRFKEYISLLMVSTVFILLTASLDPAMLSHIDGRGVALVLTVLFVTRPLTVWLSTVKAGLIWQERALIGWIGPRGVVAAAVAGVFAPELIEAGYPDANMLVPLIFVVIFSTVVLHGFSIGPLGRRLGLVNTVKNGVIIVGATPWSSDFSIALKEAGVTVLFVDRSWHPLRAARLKGVNTFFGELLSEHAEETLNFNGYTTLLAVSGNDSYNALVCNAFASEMGRDRVFQLPLFASGDKAPKEVARTQRGAIAFSHQALYDELWRKELEKWRFVTTAISDEYKFAQYLEEAGDGVMPLVAISPDGTVKVFSPARKLLPAAGDKVMSFAPPSVRQKTPKT
jgi:NhaP-type Na+/H+ or K+/H+ antiporter